jgi:hypothetical protein
LVAALGWPRYETVDDILIARLIEQGYPPVFLGHVPGKIIAALGGLLGHRIPAYPLFLLGCNALGLALILRWLLREGRQAFGSAVAVAAAGLFCLLLVRFTLRCTFTGSAVLLSSGLLLQLLAGRRPPRSLLPMLLGLAFGAAFLIRPDAGRLNLVLFAPLMAHRLILARFRPTASAALAVLGFLSVMGAETWLVSRLPADHRAWLDYNALRGQLNTTRMLDNRSRLQETLAVNRWTESDYSMFQNWLQADEQAFNPTTLSALLRNLTRDRSDTETLLQAQPLLALLKDFSDVWLLLAALSAVGLLAVRPREALFASGAAAAAILLLAFLFIWIRLPRRVADPAVIATCATVLGVLAGGMAPALVRWRRAPIRSFVAAGLLAGGLLLLTRYNLILRADNRENQSLHQAREAHYAKTLAGRVALLHNREMCMEMAGSPFHRESRPFVSLEYSWNYQSPMFLAEINQHLGVKRGSDLYPALVDHPRAVVVAQAEIIDLLLRNLADRYGIQARSEPIGDSFQQTHFVRLVSTSNPPSTP